MPVPPTPADDGGGTHFRRQPRSGGRIRARWRVDPDDTGGGAEAGGDVGSGETANVGVGGAFLETAAPLSVGTALELTLLLPGQEAPLTMGAEVRWISDAARGEGPTGMGVAFTEISDETIGRLSDWFGTLVDMVDHDDIR